MTEPRELRVLLVEDDPGERWIISEILRSRGHVVTSCARAEIAWKRFEEEPFPLVFLDWMLPGMDGLELCRRIRRSAQGDGTVVVVVTGRDEPEDLQEVLAAGADDYVTKPLDVGLMNIRLAVAEQEVREVTRRRDTQRRLEAAHRELRRLFENLDEVFFTVDVRSGSLLQVSPGARRILGRSPEELEADPELWRELLYPEELQARHASLLSRGERTVTREYSIRTPDGHVRWLEATVKATATDHAAPVRVDGIISDVTERKEAQRALSARNGELRTLHRISETVLAAESLAEAYDEIVDEVQRATGYPVVAVEHVDPERQRMVVRSARGIPEVEAGGAAEVPLGASLSGKAVRTGKPVIVTDAGMRTELLGDALRDLGLRAYLAFPMLASGRVVGTLTLAHTEPVEPDPRTVRWAGSLANSIAGLVDRVAVRDALAESDREHRALAERLRRANEELEAFAYSVSHDLRAPLRTMQGFAHTLLRDFGDRLPEEARGYVRRIIASGERSEELIGDLLAYSRLSFEEVRLRTVDLDAVVSEALDRIGGAVESTGARIDVDGDLPAVLGQKSTLVQVMVNLISNALKFVPGGRRPRVGIRSEARDGRVRLWVEDNGEGIPRAQQERIFRVFERLADQTDRPGTGIGLAIVRRGMERIGGRAGVESTPGEGSRFWIELPRARAPEGAAPRPVPGRGV